MACTRYVRTPLEHVPFEDKRRWLEMWERARWTKRLPVWGRDLTFADIDARDVPRTILAETAEDPAYTVYRFWGSGFSRPTGADMTGRRVRDLRVEGLAEAAAAQYGEVMAAAAPRFFVVRLHPFRIDESFDGMLRLPFGGDGTRVDTVLSLQFTQKDGYAVRRLWDAHAGDGAPRAAAG